MGGFIQLFGARFEAPLAINVIHNNKPPEENICIHFFLIEFIVYVSQDGQHTKNGYYYLFYGVFSRKHQRKLGRIQAIKCEHKRARRTVNRLV